MRPASEGELARLGDTFAELCRIPSPSGEEAACGERVAAELRGMGLAVEADDAGNLLARVRESYRRQAAQPSWTLIDGEQTKDAVAAEIRRVVSSRLGLL